MRLPLFLILAVSLAGCGSSEHTSTEVTKEGVDVAKNPLGALSAIADAGKDLQKWQEELANMPPVEVVHFAELVKALPDVPSGWAADDPKGETNQMGDFKMSRASRSYHNESGEERVEVTIEDWAFNQAIYVPFIMQSRFSQETMDGYSKGITVGEDPGREEYQTKSRQGSRSILAKKRYHTKIDIENADASLFDEWWPRVKIGDLP
jgi:hypothetical protein